MMIVIPHRSSIINDRALRDSARNQTSRGSRTHHDEVHVALVAESAHKLRVLWVLAVLGQAAEAGGPPVERLGAPGYFVRGGREISPCQIHERALRRMYHSQETAQAGVTYKFMSIGRGKSRIE